MSTNQTINTFQIDVNRTVWLAT